MVSPCFLLLATRDGKRPWSWCDVGPDALALLRRAARASGLPPAGPSPYFRWERPGVGYCFRDVFNLPRGEFAVRLYQVDGFSMRPVSPDA